MRKTTTKPPQHAQIRYVLIGSNKSHQKLFGQQQSLPCSTAKQIRLAIKESSIAWTWVCENTNLADALLNEASAYIAKSRGGRHRLGDLLMLGSPRPTVASMLRGCFRNVVGETSSFITLPFEQLAAALGSDDKDDRFIGGVVDQRTKTLALVRGNFEPLTVPLSIFRPSGTAKPDFRKFSLDDGGWTLQFGDYEATTDAILYEFDPDFRRKLNARRRKEDQEFGPSLRRLRIQSGLSRKDFSGVSPQTIARIERGDVCKPREKTISIIANTLNVLPNDIETY